MIPFILLLHTGFTTEFVSMFTALCSHGLNFHNIESFVMERRWERFAREQDILTQHKIITGQSVQESDFWTSPLSKSPSNDLLAKCFLAKFLQDEQLYLKEMTAIPTGDSISFDHTFKVAANIGFLREDGKWIHQYDSLFIVMNGEGQIYSNMATNKRNNFLSSWNFIKGLEGTLKLDRNSVH